MPSRLMIRGPQQAHLLIKSPVSNNNHPHTSLQLYRYPQQ
jgi:hypothetical protein